MVIQGNSTNVIQNTNPDSSELSIQVGEFVVGVFTDGFYPGEIINFEKEHITANFCSQKASNKTIANRACGRSLLKAAKTSIVWKFFRFYLYGQF